MLTRYSAALSWPCDGEGSPHRRWRTALWCALRSRKLARYTHSALDGGANPWNPLWNELTAWGGCGIRGTALGGSPFTCG